MSCGRSVNNKGVDWKQQSAKLPVRYYSHFTWKHCEMNAREASKGIIDSTESECKPTERLEAKYETLRSGTQGPVVLTFHPFQLDIVVDCHFH